MLPEQKKSISIYVLCIIPYRRKALSHRGNISAKLVIVQFYSFSISIFKFHPFVQLTYSVGVECTRILQQDIKLLVYLNFSNIF